MLRDWLGAVPLDRFHLDYLQRMPLAQPASTLAVRELLTWEVLGRLLARRPEVLVVARGELLELPAPRSLVEAQAYLRIGVGLCLRHTERVDPGLRRVADAFETEVGPAQVQVFVTPGGTHGFGWHFDDEDVFIAQTAGVKDYYLRANTVTAAPAHPRVFGRFPEEQSTLRTASLVTGDFLYIPARWWHMAICHEDSLSISVGVMSRSVERAGERAEAHKRSLAR
jgi:hypothetical protein